MPPFMDRNDAGRQLAGLLSAFRGHDVVVLAPPGDGMRVAHELAAALRVQLDVILVRPLAVERCPGLIYGLLGEDDTLLVDTKAVAHGELCESERADTEVQQSNILRRNAFGYRGDRPRANLLNRTVVLTDDCVTEATTLLDSCRMARVHGAIRIVVAVPVADHGALAALAPFADKIVCLEPTPQPTADRWYRHNDATSSADIAAMLESNHSSGWSADFAGAESRITPASRSSSMRGRCS